MKKLLSLLILLSLSTPIFAMQEPSKPSSDTPSSDTPKITIDLDEDGNPEVTIGAQETVFDVNSDGKIDFTVKNSKIKKYLEGLFTAGIIVYGADFALKYFGVEIPAINYTGGDISLATIEWFSKYGPEIYTFVKTKAPELWKKILEIRKGI
ncbi:MAG: hypothetical protein ABIF12_03505 [bacterium]